MVGEACIIINRTSRVLEVIKDGVVRKLQPGENHLSTDWIRFAKQQNPRMGTFDESGLSGEYLVGVKGFDSAADCEMLPPGKEHVNAIEKFDRSKMSGEGAEAVSMPSGVPEARRRLPSEMSPLPQETNHYGRER